MLCTINGVLTDIIDQEKDLMWSLVDAKLVDGWDVGLGYDDWDDDDEESEDEDEDWEDDDYSEDNYEDYSEYTHPPIKDMDYENDPKIELHPLIWDRVKDGPNNWLSEKKAILGESIWLFVAACKANGVQVINGNGPMVYPVCRATKMTDPDEIGGIPHFDFDGDIWGNDSWTIEDFVSKLKESKRESTNFWC